MEPLESGIRSGRNPYEPPAIIYEAPLEVRAGTPFALVDPLDPAGLGKQGTPGK
jgi:hypothetical protein